MNKIKLCFSTLPCMTADAKKLKSLCEEFGIDGVEVRQAEDGTFCYDESLNVVDIGTGICFLGYNKKEIDRAKHILKEISVTKIKAIRIFLGNFAVMKTYAKKEIDYDGIVNAVKELADSTEKEIWIETHNEFSTGRVLKKLLCDIDRKNVKVIWDIIHPIEDFEKPAQTWKYIGDKIAHVHLKDGKRDADPLKHDYQYTPLGEGELPIKEILKILRDNEYNGYVSLEWENVWRKELQCFDNKIENILRKFVDFIGKENVI